MESLQNETDVFVEELLSFNEFWERLLSIYQPTEKALLAFGLIGNLLALVTLACSKKMCTPSFVYHRALVAADLLFCVNFFVNQAIDRWTAVECRQYVFRYWFGAFFSGTLNPAITSACGYVIDYSTLIIAVDRFLALVSPTIGYQRWNKPTVAWLVTLLVVFLSCAVHSWTSFVQMTVIPYYLNESDDPLIWRPCWNDAVVYYWTKRENVSNAFLAALRTKEIYNRIIRMAYPIALSLLTLGVIVCIIRRQRRREQNRSLGRRRPSNYSLDNIELTSFVPDRNLDINSSPDRSNGIRKRRRCERALFFLMTAVLVLSFVEVGASEARRLLQLFHPPDKILRNKVADTSLPLEERLWYFRLVLYGHQASKVLANACAVIERSFICLLYMVMNKLFRQEVFAMLSLCVCWGQRGRQFRRRFDSNARNDATLIRPVSINSTVTLAVHNDGASYRRRSVVSSI